MKKWLPLLLCLLVPSAFAGLYKWVDEDGNVHYTDSPPPQGAEEVTLPPTVTYRPPRTSPTSPPGKPGAQDDEEYQELTITKPQMNETIRSNKGEVTVSFSVTPGLKPEHLYRLMLDGRALEKEITQTLVVLQQIERGSHTIQVHVVDAAGVPQISSQAVIFHLRQESELGADGTDSSTTDNTKSYSPDFERDSTEDQSSEYEDTTTSTSDDGIPQHQDESDYGTDVTDPADSRDNVYDPTYDNPSNSTGGGKFPAGTGYTPNYNQQ